MTALFLFTLDKWFIQEVNTWLKGKGVQYHWLCLNSVPDTGPWNLRATETSSTEIFLTWDEISGGKRNGIVEEYRISYSAKSLNEVVFVKAPTQQLLLEKLSIFTEYNISLSGRTAAGFGVEATVFKRTLEGGKALAFWYIFFKGNVRTKWIVHMLIANSLVDL